MGELYNYYEDEIAKVGNVKSGHPAQIKIRGNDGETKWLSLNDESAEVIVKLLTDHFNINNKNQ